MAIHRPLALGAGELPTEGPVRGPLQPRAPAPSARAARPSALAAGDPARPATPDRGQPPRPARLARPWVRVGGV